MPTFKLSFLSAVLLAIVFPRSTVFAQEVPPDKSIEEETGTGPVNDNLGLDDPDFGVIWQCDEAMWEGENARFVDAELCVSVSGDDSGPTSNARSLFRSLPSHYGDLAHSAARLIGESTEQPLSDANLLLVHVSIDTDQTPPLIELSFRIPSDPEHSHVVEVRDWVAESTYCS